MRIFHFTSLCLCLYLGPGWFTEAHLADQHLLQKPVSLRSEIEECRSEGRYYITPNCVDHPQGYGCECGPGYRWNTAVCVASAVDSRLDFLDDGELKYTKIQISQDHFSRFTISVWLKLFKLDHNSTILSYRMTEEGREAEPDSIKMWYCGTLHIKILQDWRNTGIVLDDWQWHHVIWSWQGLGRGFFSKPKMTTTTTSTTTTSTTTKTTTTTTTTAAVMTTTMTNTMMKTTTTDEDPENATAQKLRGLTANDGLLWETPRKHRKRAVMSSLKRRYVRAVAANEATTKRRHDSGIWSVYVNGRQRARGHGLAGDRVIEGNGELVLGLPSRAKGVNAFVDEDWRQFGFIGSLAHVNIWSKRLSRKRVLEIFKDCTFMQCGDLVQWVEFREGTRGASRLNWPSGVKNDSCYTALQLAESCDVYCTYKIGAFCRAEYNENLFWPHTSSSHDLPLPCPGAKTLSRREKRHTIDPANFHFTREANEGAALAWRSCHAGQDPMKGRWGESDVEGCLSRDVKRLKDETFDALPADWPADFDGSTVLERAYDLFNFTESNTVNTSTDVAALIKVAALVVAAQDAALRAARSARDGGAKYPDPSDCKDFFVLVGKTLDNLIDKKNIRAWRMTKPRGAEAARIFRVFRSFFEVVQKGFLLHLHSGAIALPDAFRSSADAVFNNIDLLLRVYDADAFRGFNFPEMPITDDAHALLLERDKTRITVESTDPAPSFRQGFLLSSSLQLTPDHATLLPNHQGFVKEDNVNSRVVAQFLYADVDGELTPVTLDDPLEVKFPYLDVFNISNPECAALELGESPAATDWLWDMDQRRCRVISNTSSAVWCGCSEGGFFVAVTDMYNIHWDRGERKNPLVQLPSYLGCSISATLCLSTAAMLFYMKTVSTTAAIHKNFALTIALGQIVFMTGINQYHLPQVCHSVAIVIHYFFLSTFLWLMNEAFNLYIVITYAAHSHGEPTEGTSTVRYYVLGWILPIVVVGVIAGIHGDAYYSSEMCLINLEHFWFFVGPVAGFVVISALVMIVTAKEQHESSYSKNEKANKVIQNHTKAVWTQIILLSSVWTFVILSIRMLDVLIKWLFMVFNVLQGTFFFIFYFLLHEEVRAALKDQRKFRRNLGLIAGETRLESESTSGSGSGGSSDSSDSSTGDGADSLASREEIELRPKWTDRSPSRGRAASASASPARGAPFSAGASPARGGFASMGASPAHRVIGDRDCPSHVPSGALAAPATTAHSHLKVPQPRSGRAPTSENVATSTTTTTTATMAATKPKDRSGRKKSVTRQKSVEGDSLLLLEKRKSSKKNKKLSNKTQSVEETDRVTTV